jgi:hypothetical protein
MANDNNGQVPEQFGSLAAILSEADLVGVIGRDSDVNVMDISRSGCMMESPRDVVPGTLGTVRVTVKGAEYADAVRIVWSTPLLGAGDRYAIGAEFVWLGLPAPRSLRRLASRISAAGGETATGGSAAP